MAAIEQMFKQLTNKLDENNGKIESTIEITNSKLESKIESTNKYNRCV